MLRECGQITVTVVPRHATRRMPEHSLTLGHRQTCRERTDKLGHLHSEVASSVQFERCAIRVSPGVYCGGACAKMKILATAGPPCLYMTNSEPHYRTLAMLLKCAPLIR